MRVFVSEYISSGALSGRPLPNSLLQEGKAMLTAVVADLSRLPDCQVTTTLDRRLPPSMIAQSTVAHFEWIDDVHSEQSALDRMVKAADVTLVIAPETDGILAQRVRRVLELGGRTSNCSPTAIELCGDKWSLFQYLENHRLPTIPTDIADLSLDDPWTRFDASCVLKPRDGAGSWLTFHLPHADRAAWQSAVHMYQSAGFADRGILQPFISGMPVSAACLCHSNGKLEVFPISLQQIDGRTLQYQGGRVPASISEETRDNIENLIRQTCATIPGLRGYIGFDLILPDRHPASPLITEINPRLTTSYVGYRQLVQGNLAARLLAAALDAKDQLLIPPRLVWKRGVIQFLSNGVHTFEDAPPANGQEPVQVD